MTIKEASSALHTQYHSLPWFVAIGIHKDKESYLILYIKYLAPEARLINEQGWQGHEVEVKVSGEMIPT